jgi:hypothetical protein
VGGCFDVDTSQSFFQCNPVLTRPCCICLQFTTRGTVTLRVSVEDDPSGKGQRLVFAVIDTGIGIREDKLDDLFKPFEQTDLSIAREFGALWAFQELVVLR